MDYCAWLMKVMDNAYGTGSYDLIASRPDNWQQMSDKYGYEYNPDNLGTYESQRDALLKAWATPPRRSARSPAISPR